MAKLADGRRQGDTEPHSDCVEWRDSLRHNDRWRVSLRVHPGWDERFEKALHARLSSLSPGVPNVWLATLPYALGRYDTSEFRQRIDCINASIRKVNAVFPEVRTLPLADIECPKGACYTTFEGELMRPDGVHYNINAARPIAERVLEVLRRDTFGDFKPLTVPDSAH